VTAVAIVLLIDLTACGPPRWQREYNAYCDRAITRAWEVAARHMPGAAVNDTLYGLSYCGREGAAAAGAIFMSLRMSSDTAWFSALASYGTGGNGIMLLEPMLAVAEDARASDMARITALIGLLRLTSGKGYLSYRDVTGGFEDGFPARQCGLGKSVTDQGELPKPTPSDAARIVAAAKRIRTDPTSALDLQTAAACVLAVTPPSR
jgi:hypothetical protein